MTKEEIQEIWRKVAEDKRRDVVKSTVIIGLSLMAADF
jgi:hypothetical protein